MNGGKTIYEMHGKKYESFSPWSVISA